MANGFLPGWAVEIQGDSAYLYRTTGPVSYAQLPPPPQQQQQQQAARPLPTITVRAATGSAEPTPPMPLGTLRRRASITLAPPTTATQPTGTNSVFRAGTRPIPAYLTARADRAVRLKTNPEGFPTRAELKKSLPGDFTQRNGRLKQDCELGKWYGDTRLFSKQMWLYLKGEEDGRERKEGGEGEGEARKGSRGEARKGEAKRSETPKHHDYDKPTDQPRRPKRRDTRDEGRGTTETTDPSRTYRAMPKRHTG
jgi:hypothetical protein